MHALTCSTLPLIGGTACDLCPVLCHYFTRYTFAWCLCICVCLSVCVRAYDVHACVCVCTRARVCVCVCVSGIAIVKTCAALLH